jgi:hypothetical protein
VIRALSLYDVVWRLTRVAGSRECQVQDWKPDHQAECARLKQLAALKLHADQVSDVLMLGRVMRCLGRAKGEDRDRIAGLVWFEEDVASHENLLLATLAGKLQLVDGASTRFHDGATGCGPHFMCCSLAVGAGVATDAQPLPEQ